MSLWTAEEATAATGGKTASHWSATGVSIDTRTLQRGDLFVALKDARDGHDFVAQALDKGAAAALVSRVPDSVSRDKLLIVKDVLQGLEALGQTARERTRAQVIAITGSVGKTSTKEMMRTVLSRQGSVHAAEASYNNHWGVPLTLARMPEDVDFAILEIGMNHPGEIAPLAKQAAPDVALITTIAAAHLEAFDDLAGIAREKASIFEGLRKGGTALIPGDLDETPVMQASHPTAKTFGQSNHPYQITDIRLGGGATIVRAKIGDEDVTFKLSAPGRHFAQGALAILAVVDSLNLDLALAAQDLALWQPVEGRGLQETRLLDQMDTSTAFDLYDDAFNANPTSMAASLEVLAAATPVDNVGRITKGRRIAILGDMLELGPEEAAMHKNIADLSSMDAVDLVHTVGPRMLALFQALPVDKQGVQAETADELAARAHNLVDAGDVILVKGSKGSKVSLLVDALRKLSHPQATENEG